MSEYIRREDAINVAQNYHCSHDITIIPNTDYSRGFYDGLAVRENDILQGLSELKPSADVVQVRHAIWERYSGITIRCSRCEHVIHDWRYSECNFCPNCGAKMDREE